MDRYRLDSRPAIYLVSDTYKKRASRVTDHVANFNEINLYCGGKAFEWK